MIVKPKSERESKAPRIAAGEKAEQQMAHYLNRAFSADETVLVLNDLRLVDPAQPEHNSADGSCQIDHLVLHRWGAFIIESKSVSEAVSVRSDGTGGDEWRRMYRGKEEGMPSPIQQAKRQGDFLRNFLQRHRETLRDKAQLGTRTLRKLIHGTDQLGFQSMPIQIVVAIADDGKIDRIGGWKEPEKPFQIFVCKADLVPDKIRGELDIHRSMLRSALDEQKRDYGLWTLDKDELDRVGHFLCDNHTPHGRSASHPASSTVPAPVAKLAQPAPVVMPPQPLTRPAPVPAPVPAPAPARIVPQAAVCKFCGGSDLIATWGHSYYWKCACGKNTPMPTICHNCNAEGDRGKIVRIRKEGQKFYRCCDVCNVQQLIWTNP